MRLGCLRRLYYGYAEDAPRLLWAGARRVSFAQLDRTKITPAFLALWAARESEFLEELRRERNAEASGRRYTFEL